MSLTHFNFLNKKTITVYEVYKLNVSSLIKVIKCATCILLLAENMNSKLSKTMWSLEKLKIDRNWVNQI